MISDNTLAVAVGIIKAVKQRCANRLVPEMEAELDRCIQELESNNASPSFVKNNIIYIIHTLYADMISNPEE